MALDECMMGGFASTFDATYRRLQNRLQNRLTQLQDANNSLLEDSGTQPGFDDGTPPGPAPAEGGA